MSGKLDQSLDQIMKDTKPSGGRGRNKGRPARNAANKAKAAVAAPTGGVQKTTRVRKDPVVAVSTRPAVPQSGESKIIVSNLPEDVTETQIKVR